MARIKIIILVLVAFYPLSLNAQGSFRPPANQGLQFRETPVNEETVMQFIVISTPVNDVIQNVRIEYPDGPFTAGPINFNFEPGQEVPVTVTFSPEEAGDFNVVATVVIGSPMGPRQWVYEYPWRGTGVGAGDPDIEIDPEEISLSVTNENPEDRQRLWVTNVGRSLLEVEIGEPRVDWFSVDPGDGEVEPDEGVAFWVSTTENVPDNGEYASELIMATNDPDEREVRVPVSLTVNLEPENVVAVIPLRPGWSMISSNLDFADEFIGENGPDIELILADIIESVIIIKDGQGRFSIPEFDYWGIPFWNTAEGYLIKTSEQVDLEITGIPIPFDREIELESSWSMIAYYPDYDLTFEQIFADIVDLVEIAKNGDGDFYTPEFGYGGNFVIHPYDGILVKVREACILQYPQEP